MVKLIRPTPLGRLRKIDIGPTAKKILTTYRYEEEIIIYNYIDPHITNIDYTKNIINIEKIRLIPISDNLNPNIKEILLKNQIEKITEMFK